MNPVKPLALLLPLTLAACGGAQTVREEPVVAEEEPVAEAPPPVLVATDFRHPAFALPLAGSLDPNTTITVGERRIVSSGDGAFTFVEGESSAPVPARWVENLVTSLQAPLLGLACPAPRGRRAPATPPVPLYTVTSGETTSTYQAGCTVRGMRAPAVAEATTNFVGRFDALATVAVRLQAVTARAVGQAVPDATFRMVTNETEETPGGPPEGRAFHRRISALASGPGFELCTETLEDPQATGEGACFPLHESFVAAIARDLRDASCTPDSVDASCSAFDAIRLTLENADEWSPAADLSAVGTTN